MLAPPGRFLSLVLNKSMKFTVNVRFVSVIFPEFSSLVFMKILNIHHRKKVGKAPIKFDKV